MVMSTDPVEQLLIEVHSLRDRDGRLAAYRLGEDLQDEIRIAQILVAKITAMEREACARVAERSESALHCAAAIRARSQP